MKSSAFIQDEVENAQKHELTDLIIQILVAQLRGLKGDPGLQELMLWEMLERNELTIAIAKEREEKGYELSKKMKEKMNISGDESHAVIALLVSGIYYLVLRSRTVDVFNGVDLNSENGWLQIEKAIQLIVRAYFNSIEKKTGSKNKEKK